MGSVLSTTARAKPICPYWKRWGSSVGSRVANRWWRSCSRYAPTWLVQMPALMSDTELEALQRKVQGATRERMLREMAEAIEALTAERPLVLVIEDVHWSDHSTLDLLALLAQRRGPARLFLLATYRPADVVVSGHPLKALKQELQVHGQCEELPLGFLTTV